MRAGFGGSLAGCKQGLGTQCALEGGWLLVVVVQVGEKSALVKLYLVIVRKHRYCMRISWSAVGKWCGYQLTI